MIYSRIYVLVVVMILLPSLSACTGTFIPSKSLDNAQLQAVSFQLLDDWSADNHLEAINTFLVSCKRMLTIPEERLVHLSGIGGHYRDWHQVCRAAQSSPILTSDQARDYFEHYFSPYLVSDHLEDEGLFTGYYEIGLYGSRVRHTAYQNPIYQKPSDLLVSAAYHSREAIESGELDGRGLELLWLNDPVNVFFLHIQGSGVVFLDDGTQTRVGYAGKNNQPYRSLGRQMIDDGILKSEDVTATSIKQWLFDNPMKAGDMMAHNKSYVFFRETDQRGPIGAQGVTLTPIRSLAVDKRFMPYGAPMWVDVMLNGDEHYPSKTLRRLMVAQDTGGAIRGKIRGDIFFGAGDEAEAYASTQNARGKYYLLLPKTIDVNQRQYAVNK